MTKKKLLENLVELLNLAEKEDKREFSWREKKYRQELIASRVTIIKTIIHFL